MKLGELNISQLRNVQFGPKGFQNLVLDRKYKTIVQALVKSYVEKNSDFKDLVDGKGKGLVALLHGAPGTGKTLTAGIWHDFSFCFDTLNNHDGQNVLPITLRDHYT